jgi:methyltransferase (TIGR00027 family)
MNPSKANLFENVSDTALWVAMFRSRESHRPDALFNDPYAERLAGERGHELVRSLPYSQIMEWVLALRTVAIDELIQNAIQQGADTIVNIGAGLDTRPYRMELPETLRWIEIDLPGIIALKNDKLRGERPRCRLDRISFDFSDRRESRAIFGKIGRQSRKVAVLTEGVLPYLSNLQVIELAEDLFAQPNFEFWIQDFRNGFKRSMPRGWARLFKNAPLKFDVYEWIEYFAPYGWVPHKTLYMADEAERLGRPYPFVWPWSLILRFFPKSFIDRTRRAAGYVMFHRAQRVGP